MLRRLRLECEVAIFRFDRAGGRGSPFIGNDRDRLASTDESSTIAIVSGGTTGNREARFGAALLSRQRLSPLLPWRNQPSGFARPARTLPRPARTIVSNCQAQARVEVALTSCPCRNLSLLARLSCLYSIRNIDTSTAPHSAGLVADC
jgi:hypothetical protein